MIHRNYMDAMIQIRVYDDSINIWNEGTLPAGISSEALKKPHRSIPRNPIIAGVCFKGGLIDSWGSGTVRIIEACKQAGLPEPEFVEEFGGLLITLFKNNLTAEQLSTLGLNERQVDALLYFKEKGEILSSEYMKRYDVTDRTARYDLSEMVEMNILMKIGDRKSTKYVFR